ncbi:lipocalin family protein [Sphingomicrobium clamense]|uniref:Outer membrane lipoprotein Blc n=1 Tax=Sphingomicrobium clamense TaxID=2851013 RepID=A0ABS6V5Y2_9SPHN|nr:lipocalin family protein [Sphingomicrobium sp. B8]MBW0144970.1 lipocalin family protein [Sphingomicrobium sp. B8]
MRTIALLVAALSLSGCATIFDKHPVGNPDVPEPAKSVDLERYVGTWYELARYEQGFQKGCEGVTATYTLRDDGKIGVVNRCREPDGDIDTATGKAKVVDAATNAKLKVSFFGPFYGDYWVLDRGDDYDWAIVGDPSGRYLWILSRWPDPGEDVFQNLKARAAALGYDTGYLRKTAQP